MNKWTIGMLLVLTALLATYFITKNEKHAATEEIKERMNFAVEDKEDIYRIFLAGRTGEPMTMTRQGDTWYLQDGHEVNPFVLKPFMDRLEHFRVKYVPNEKEVENALPGLSSHGIKVELYDKQDDLIISYYVGGVIKGEEGAYFYKEGSDQPYVVHVPYGGMNVRHMFDLHPDMWKRRSIFRHQLEDIEAVHIRYPRAELQGFDIVRDDDDFQLSALASRRIDANQPQDDLKLKQYLLSFKGLAFASIQNDATPRDSIVSMQPFMQVTLVTRDSDTLGVQVWPMKKQLSTPYEAYTETEDGDSYIVLNHLSDFGVIPYRSMKKFFVGYADLLKDE